MKRAQVLAFTSLFRTPHERVRAPFTGEFLRALQEFAAVNRWGQLGRWRFLPCHEPQRLIEQLGRLAG
mgnify:CR=1 FL=1